MALPLLYNPPANQTDYTSFLRSIGFDTTVLPTASPYIPDSLQVAMDIINQDALTAVPNEGVRATYNLAADILINYVPDQTPALTSLVWAAGVVTATSTAALPSNFIVGGQPFNSILAGQTPAAYSGTYLITVTSGVNFTYALAANPGAETVPGTYSANFFATLRKNWNINAITTGVVQATSDESTSTALLNPEFMEGLTMENLQQLKTPYGRAYIAFAQKYGTLWGLT